MPESAKSTPEREFRMRHLLPRRYDGVNFYPEDEVDILLKTYAEELSSRVAALEAQIKEALGSDYADYYRLAKLLEMYDTAMGKDRDFAKVFALRMFEKEQQVAALEQRIADAIELLRKVPFASHHAQIVSVVEAALARLRAD